MTDGNKFKVAVLGGCGFIGKEIVYQLLDEPLVSSITVVDKVPPPMAWLGPRHKSLFDNEKVSFRSANLIMPKSVEMIFDTDYHWVINAAGETKRGRTDSVYDEGIVKLSTNVAQMCAKRGVPLYLEVSDGCLIPSGKQGVKESDSCKPWNAISACKAKVEKVLQKMNNLNWVIVRPALVYGVGDRKGLATNLVVGAVYRHLNETLEMLWGRDLQVNTVHVTDLARAIIFLCKSGKTKEIYNIVDSANSTQGSLAKHIGAIFDVEIDFTNTLTSTLSKQFMEDTVSYVNEKHLPPWAEVCKSGGIENTPLSPYIDGEMLKGHPLNLSGEKMATTEFKFLHPEPTLEIIREILNELIELKIFPEKTVN